MADLDLDALERAARDALWTGRWYDGGCDTLMAERDGEREDVAHPVPLGIVPFLVAAQPVAVLELVRRLRAAESRLHEVSVHCAAVEQQLAESRANALELEGRLRRASAAAITRPRGSMGETA